MPPQSKSDNPEYTPSPQPSLEPTAPQADNQQVSSGETSPEIHASPSTGLPSTLSEPPAPPAEPVPVSVVDQEPATIASQSPAPAEAAQSNQPQVSTEFVNPAVYQPTSESHPAAMQPSAAKKPRRTRLVLLITAAVLVVLFGSASAVYALWYNNPKKVVADAIQSAVTAKTTLTGGTVVFVNESSSDEFKAEVSFTSSVHNVDSHGQVDATLKLTSPEATSELSGAGMVSESGAIYLKFNDVEKLYTDFIKKQEMADMITQDPKLSQSVQSFIKKIDGAWIKISQDDIQQLNEKYDYGKFKQCEQTAQNNFIQSKEQQQELRDMYDKHEFVQLTQNGTVTIDGALTNKYDVGFDVGKAYDAYAASQNTAYVKAVLACSKHVADVSEQGDFKKPSDAAVREQQQGIDKLKTEMYVTQFTHELKRLTLNYADNEQKTSINAVFNFGFNQAVNSPDPAKSIPVSELQKDFKSIQEQLTSSDLEGSRSVIEP